MESAKSFFRKLPLSRGPVHCVGIGGAGVSTLAEILLEAGIRVSGSDLVDNDKCRKLRSLGGMIAPPGHRAGNLPYECAGVIATSAARADNPELAAARSRGVRVWRRGEFLAEIAACYRRVTAVAGAHGKSSVSALTSWILRENKIDAGFMVGAELNGGAPNGKAGNGDIFVTEADESDGTFALLAGELALIPNIDDDHAWDAGARAHLEAEFVRFARAFRKVFYIAGETADRLLGTLPNAERLAGARLAELAAAAPAGMVGFERINAALALAGTAYLGVSVADGAHALENFPGVARRMTERARSADSQWLVVEDYAHHPAELAASLDALRKRYAGRQLTVIFQPHRFQRLARYFDRFVKLLSEGCDRVYLPPVFAAWSEQGEVDSRALARCVNDSGGCAEAVAADYAQLAEQVTKDLRVLNVPAVVAVIGAGDLDAVIPELEKKFEKIANRHCQTPENPL